MVSALLNPLVPIVAIVANLLCIETSAKSSASLGLSVVVKAQNREVGRDIIRGILIDVMNLNLLASCATNATCSVSREKDLSSDINRNRYPRFTTQEWLPW
jgi:hypothetical protein